MQRAHLEVEFRERHGKGAARQIRREGQIPAVLYGEGKSILLSVHPKALVKILQSESGENALINMKIKGSAPKTETTVILRDFQKDPITEQILHADFFEVSMNKPIRVKVTITTHGEPPGIKEGGVLQHNLRDLEIECLPAMIPDHVEVDVSSLGIGEIIHVRDVQLDQNIKILQDSDAAVISVVAPISEAKLEEMLTSAPAEATATEPEVTTKGKEKEEPEAETPEAKPAEKSEGKSEKEQSGLKQ